MFKKIFINLSIIFLLSLFSYSFLPNLSVSLNPWLAIMSFLILFFDFPIILTWLIAVGIFMPLFSILPFGVHLIIFFAIYLVLQHLIKSIFTHQSLSTLVILVMMASLIFNGLIWLASLILGLLSFKIFYNFSLNTIFVQLAVNILIAIILFLGLKFFTKRLRLDEIYRE